MSEYGADQGGFYRVSLPRYVPTSGVPPHHAGGEPAIESTHVLYRVAEGTEGGSDTAAVLQGKALKGAVLQWLWDADACNLWVEMVHTTGGTLRVGPDETPRPPLVHFPRAPEGGIRPFARCPSGCVVSLHAGKAEELGLDLA